MFMLCVNTLENRFKPRLGSLKCKGNRSAKSFDVLISQVAKTSNHADSCEQDITEKHGRI